MKTTKIILFTLLFVCPIKCNSQTADSLIIIQDSTCIGVDSSKILYSLLYEIENKSSTAFYLWIEKDIHSTEREKIRDYIIRNKGDMSVYQMAMETEITFGCRAIFCNFLKKINPQEKFNIQIISSEELSDCKKKQIFKYLDDHVVILSEDKIKQYILGLDSFNPLLFYKYNFITIPVSMINI